MGPPGPQNRINTPKEGADSSKAFLSILFHSICWGSPISKSCARVRPQAPSVRCGTPRQQGLAWIFLPSSGHSGASPSWPAARRYTSALCARMRALLQLQMSVPVAESAPTHHTSSYCAPPVSKGHSLLTYCSFSPIR